MKEFELEKFNKEINEKTYLYYRLQVINVNCPGRLCMGEWTWSNSKKDIITHFKEVFLDDMLRELYVNKDISPSKDIRALRMLSNYKTKKRTYEEIIILMDKLNENEDDITLEFIFKRMPKLMGRLGYKCEAYFFNDYNKALKLVKKHYSNIYQDDLVKTFQEDVSL